MRVTPEPEGPELKTSQYPLSGGQQGVKELPVDQPGSSGVGRQQPDDEGYLQLVVEGEPGDGQTHVLSFDHPSDTSQEFLGDFRMAS